MYLSSNDDLLIAQSVELIIAKTIIDQSRDVNIDNIEAILEHINSSLANSADVRRMLSELQAGVSKSVQKCQENLITHESHIKRSIREMSRCITKAMVKKITTLAPEIESRADNIDPSQPITTDVDLSPIGDDITYEITYDDNNIQDIFMQKGCKSDRNLFAELLLLPWLISDYQPISKYICELSSKNMLLKVVALKTKTTIFIEFQNEIEIPDCEFNGIIYKISKDNLFICQLNEPLLTFIKKYMDL